MSARPAEAESRTFSPSSCRVRSRGTAPASTASDGLSDARARRRRATTSSRPGESPRRCKRWVPAAATCAPLASPVIGPGAFASTSRPASCASPITVNSSPLGWRSSRRLWLTQAFASAHPADWSAFLGSLPGHPRRIVCDAHGVMLQAIAARRPQAELHQCEWHLQHALDRLLAKEARHNPSGELNEL